MTETSHAPANPDKPAIGARSLALELLVEVLNRHQPLDAALEQAYRRDFVKKMEPRDRAFARMLVTTVLRRLGDIDVILENYMDRYPEDHTRTARHILRMGVAQLVFLELPAHAGVATSVDLVEKHSRPELKGLVNGVLRRVSDHSCQRAKDILKEKAHPAFNFPKWLRKNWDKPYKLGTRMEMFEALKDVPPLDLTVKSNPEGWAEKLGGQVMPGGTVRLSETARVEELEGYEEGAWWVQDAAAALPARLFGNVKGKRVADLCAAPGGKTAQLAAAGANVVAVDRAEKRLSRLKENLERLSLDAETVCSDALKFESEELFDGILLDAPCTSTGTYRRQPDILHLKRPGDIEKLVEVQKKLVEHAATLLKPGGMLVYCVCSLEPDEGEEIAAWALTEVDGLKRMPILAQEVGGEKQFITKGGFLRTLPAHWADKGRIDGFFAARFRKSI